MVIFCKRKYDEAIRYEEIEDRINNHKKKIINEIIKHRFVNDNSLFEKMINDLNDIYKPSFIKKILEEDSEEIDSLLSIFSYELQDSNKLEILLKYFKFDKNTLIKVIESIVDCEYDPEGDIHFLEELLKLFKFENKEIENIRILKYNDLATIKLLMKHGYKPKDHNLHTCCIYFNTQLLEFLLKDCKLDPNTQCSNGWTPMHHAYQNVSRDEEDSDMIKILIKYGGDPNIRDEKGKLPKDIRMR